MAQPAVEKDFLELLKLFNKNKVRYCIVGAFAVGFHAVSRYTKDMDILVEPSLENGKRIIAALKEFGFGGLKISAEDFARKGSLIQLGYEPLRIDLISSIEGVTFSQVWKNKKKGVYGHQKVFFIGLGELVRNKKVSGRKQDLADLEILEKIRGKTNLRKRRELAHLIGSYGLGMTQSDLRRLRKKWEKS